MGTAISMPGTLHVYPFGTSDRAELVATEYATLLEAQDVDEILCLTRLCSDQRLTERLTDSIEAVVHPSVITLTDLAKEIIRSHTPGSEFVSAHERIELLASFLETREWETSYLAAAAEQESFRRDIGELLIDLESRNALSPTAYTTATLQEVAAVGRDFTELLETREYVDEPSVIPRAIAALDATLGEDDKLPTLEGYSTILVADFEEYAPTERRFLELVARTADASITALAERNSRLLSSWRETGGVESMADGLTVTTHQERDDPVAAPQAIAEYLVTGNRSTEAVPEGSVKVIEAPTLRDQITQVADEIERLCRNSGYTYADIKIAYQDSQAPIEQTIRLLRRNGIPTTTIAVTQLGTDPAVRELHDVVKVCAETVDEDTKAASRSRLLAVDKADEPLLTDLKAASTAESGLWQWIGATHMKDRIGRDWREIEARDQFRRVRDVLDLAAFSDQDPALTGDWNAFLPTLERAFQYSSPRLENIETDRDGGGVPIGTIYGLKYSSHKAVFLLNVTDQEYPFVPDLTALMPPKQLQGERQFPVVTPQSSADVNESFSAASGEHDAPFHAYFAKVSRRLLGIGARAAEDRLYFGLPREGTTAIDTYHQPSRFLMDLIDQFDCIEPLDRREDLHGTSHGSANEYVVEHVDDVLEAVRRASVGGDQVDLDANERELAAITDLLESPHVSTARAVMEARIEYRHGRVRRD